MSHAGPISQERLRAALEVLDTKYRTDDDGEFTGWWGDYQWMRFNVAGQAGDVLHIWGVWAPRPPVGLAGALGSVLNTWNAEKLWPKAYLMERGDVLEVRTELNIDCEGGVTDAWLVQQVKCGVGTTGQLFEHLEASYPEFVAWIPE